MNFIKKNWLIIALCFLLPTIALAQGVKLPNPLDVNSPVEIFARLVTSLVAFTGILAMVFFVLGGFRILTAAGSEEKYAKGKTILLYSAIGFIATISSYYILTQVIDILTGGAAVEFKYSQNIINPLNLFPTNPNAPLDFYGRRIMGTIISLVGVVGVLTFVYAGVLWMTAAGNEEKISKAKKTMIYAVIGIAAIFGSYTVLNYVYKPVYDILNSGELPAAGPGTPSPVGACFIGNACSMKSKEECDVANSGVSGAATNYYSNTTCDEIGCCKQTQSSNPIYTPQEKKSRVKENACQPTIFAPFTAALYTCFPDPDGFLVNINDACYFKTEFIKGNDCS